MPDITDEQIIAFARHAADRIPESNYEGRVIHAVRMALSTPPAATPAATGEGVPCVNCSDAQQCAAYTRGQQSGRRAALAQPAPVAAPADPMDWPLPCDVTVGHGTMRKGVSLRTLVTRMKALYEMATGNDADVVAAPAPAASKYDDPIWDEEMERRSKEYWAKFDSLASPSTPEPAAADDVWPKYIAGIIETYLQSNPSGDVREAAIAGIIARRMWSMKKPEPAAASGAVAPAAYLVRMKKLLTPARLAADGQDHYGEWSKWHPEEVGYAEAIADPSRNRAGAEAIYEAVPLDRRSTSGGESVDASAMQAATPEERQVYKQVYKQIATNYFASLGVVAADEKPFGWWLETGTTKHNRMYWYEAEAKAAWQAAGGASSEAYLVPLYRRADIHAGQHAAAKDGAA